MSVCSKCNLEIHDSKIKTAEEEDMLGQTHNLQAVAVGKIIQNENINAGYIPLNMCTCFPPSPKEPSND